MNGDFLINTLLSFALLLIGLMFIEGIWHKKGVLIKSLVNIDNFFFPELQDKRILILGDQLAFIVCIGMALFTFVNGIFCLFNPSFPNISGIFVFIGVLLSWPIRVIFIFVNRNKDFDKVSSIWPLKKPQ